MEVPAGFEPAITELQPNCPRTPHSSKNEVFLFAAGPSGESAPQVVQQEIKTKGVLTMFKRFEFSEYCHFIEAVMPGQHYLVKYSKIIKKRIMCLDPKSSAAVDFFHKWNTEVFLKAVSLIRFTEKKYASHGIVLNEDAIASLFIDYLKQYDSINDSEEDDFESYIADSRLLITKRINNKNCIIKLMDDRAYWWSAIDGEVLEPLTSDEINQYQLKNYLSPSR